jgi:hypothetical protein
MGFEVEKASIVNDVAHLEEQLRQAKRRLEKLEKVQVGLFESEPKPGTVLRFSRSLAGSSYKYSFVAFRAAPNRNGWYLTGRQNALQLLGLNEKGNTWDDLLVAIADAKVKVATGWTDPGEVTPKYEYFRGIRSGQVYRLAEGVVRTEYKTFDGRWVSHAFATSDWIKRNTDSYISISEDEALS